MKLIVQVYVAIVTCFGLQGALWAQNPVTKACPVGVVVDQPVVPNGAIWQTEYLHPGRATAPPNFHTAISHITVVTAQPCAMAKSTSSVAIRAWRVYERIGQAAPQLMQTLTFDGSGSASVGSGGIFPRTVVTGGRDVQKWYGETTGTDEPVVVHDVVNGEYHMDPSRIARRLFHNWSQPRVEAKPGARYLVEMEVRISGSARLQIGLDWWRGMNDGYTGYDSECHNPNSQKNQSAQPANNCEAWMSQWFGDTGGQFVTVRTPAAYWR